MIIYNSNKRHSKYKVIFIRSEIGNLISNIKWERDVDYTFVTKNDRLSKTEIKNILKSNPNLDFLNTDSFFEIENAICRNFSVHEYLKQKSLYLGNKTSQIMGEQIVPVNNSPTFSFGLNKYVWRSELGLFEILDEENECTGFYNSLTRSLVFKELHQYDKYIEEINFFKSKLENYMEKEDKERYVRVITVYDKVTKELKYRILNEEFNYNSFAHMNMQPFENDELFFKSYLITEKLAKEYSGWAYIDVDFDFTKNEYYFETLNAETFTYSVSEIFKEIATM